MTSAKLQSISGQIRDLQGYCRIASGAFIGDQNETRYVLQEICENLERILSGMGELCETTNGPSNPVGNHLGLSLIQ